MANKSIDFTIELGLIVARSIQPAIHREIAAIDLQEDTSPVALARY